MVYIVGLLVFVGVFFFIVGTVGLIRFPDTYTRIHAPTKCDTLGLGLIILGLIIYNGFSVVSVKLILILLFLWTTSPTAASAISNAAMEKNIPFCKDTVCYLLDDQDRDVRNLD